MSDGLALVSAFLAIELNTLKTAIQPCPTYGIADVSQALSVGFYAISLLNRACVLRGRTQTNSGLPANYVFISPKNHGEAQALRQTDI